MQSVFITGGTGYMGRRLVKRLVKDGYYVKALIRKGSENKLPNGCDFIIADPFDADSFWREIPPYAVFVQLLGVPHPGPSKKEFFRSVDLVSAEASAEAAARAEVVHFIYVSVAQTPTNIMRDFQQSRAEAEATILKANVPVTFIRPWYVVGPGHYWPLLFLPLYKILEWIPSTSAKARSLRLVYLDQMLRVLVQAVHYPPQQGLREIEVAAIRKFNG